MRTPPLPTILNWAASEGWNPGLDDAAAFLAADPDGFFTHDVDGQPVAAISVVNHSDDFAFLGLYLCRPEYRGQGLGLALWNRAIQHAGSRTIGLDGVPDQQGNYCKSGFQLAGQTVRWQGVLAPGMSAARPVTPADIAKILRWDRDQCGYQRRDYLTHWLQGTDTRHSLCINRQGKIAAYGTVRRCVDGVKIGPFAAETDQDASDLLAGLVQADSNSGVPDMPVMPVMVDIPGDRPALSDLLKQKGFTPGFETARMYKGAAPKANPARFSAVTSLELG
jgi:GNAT superfamily N-acetyltransferase